MLISVSFLHIIPKSFEMNANAPIYLLSGFVLLHLFNRFITAFVCERDPDSQYGIGLAPMFGIGLHSFIDGFIYSITFTVSIFTGALAATGMVLNEIRGTIYFSAVRRQLSWPVECKASQVFFYPQ